MRKCEAIMMTHWYGSEGWKQSCGSWTHTFIIKEKKNSINFKKDVCPVAALASEVHKSQKWTVSLKFSLRVKVISAGISTRFCYWCWGGWGTNPGLRQPQQTISHRPQIEEGEESAPLPPPQAWDLLEMPRHLSKSVSALSLAGAAEPHASSSFFFLFFLLRSTCQQLYHYPKKENVFGSVGGPRLWKRTSHNDSRFIKATSVSACCASICLFHSGFFFFLQSFLN